MEYNKHRFHGTYKVFELQGKLISKLIFHNNTPIHLIVNSDDPEFNNFNGNLKNGTGKIITYTRNLTTNKRFIKSEKNYVDSTLNGLTKKYARGHFICEGEYKNGFLNGVWKFYNSSGEVEKTRKYDYLEEKVKDSNENCFYEDNRIYKVENMPKFLKNDHRYFTNFIVSSLAYPINAGLNNEEGIVYVRFTINEHGELINPKIMKGVSKTLDNISLEVVSSSPFWTPGFQGGIPTAITFTYPINFIIR